MNYRHSFHAGNFADVFKHIVLVQLIEHLCRKPTAFCILDSHAGSGLYDLGAVEAERTREYQGGIARVAVATDPPPLVQRYLSLVRDAGPVGAVPMRWYPGSPRLARALMRTTDRLVVAELHGDTAGALKRCFRGDAQVAVHQMDGYQALKAHLPPRERRGLVLIDPPYEATDEAERIVAGLGVACRRWPGGLYAVWYPIKERAAVWRFHEAIAGLGLDRALTAELTVFPEERSDRLNGCGMVLINPPWQFDQALAGPLAWLHRVLAVSGGAPRMAWLARETGTAPSDDHQGGPVI
ncbi:MAG: 23S rRNA (adenine(2030)-N(6))-methyltransferase RlmJ [Azospirillum sp.]|nr:23S rRNA (adenine(2030)-N(6))-methyltransferase RlmJ [Azospirillum sp.]